MNQIQIVYGCTKTISFQVVNKANNQPINLRQGEYMLKLNDKPIDFDIVGENHNKVRFTIQGAKMLPVGTYSLTFWMNAGKEWQMRFPMRDCIKITRY